MNKIKAFILLAAMIVCGQYSELFGQASAKFDCTTSGMILTQGNGSNQTTFYHVNTNANPFTFDVMFTIPYNLNSTGYNPVDNYLYAFPSGTATTLLRVDAKGNYDVLTAIAPETPPAGGGYKAGTIDNKGFYYLSGSSSNTLYYIDLNNPDANNQYQTGQIVSSPSVAFNVADIAWNPADDKLYGVEVSSTNNVGKLAVITVNFNGSTKLPSGISTQFMGSENSTLNQFGAMYVGSNGVIYGSLNAGGFYEFDINSGARVKVSDSPGSTTNDGANCPLVPITFGTDIQVTKTDNTDLLVRGRLQTYSITVTNAGPFGASNIQVSDPLPAGIPAENASYTATATDGATTTVTSAKTGAISDQISLEVGASVTYTVEVTAPANYASNELTNTVTVTPDANATNDTDLSNNSASDTDKAQFIPVNPHVRGWLKN